MRRARFLGAAFGALLLLTQPAWADTTLDTSTTLSTNVAVPSVVNVGANSFTIRVNGTTGNIPSSKNGIVNVVNSYSMSTAGVITAGATTTTITLPKINYNGCPTTGTIPQGCPANPFLVTATLNVAAGTPNNTNGTLTVVATPDGDAGVTADATPALGRVRVTVANSAPTVGSISGAASVNEGSSGTYGVSAVDPDGDTLTYAWSVTAGNATVPGTNASAVTVAFGDGPSNVTLQVVVNDGQGHSVTRTLAITVNNVAPTATFNAPASVGEGSLIALALTSPADVSSADTSAGLTYAFDCGSGYGAFSATSTASCATTDNGSRTVKGSVRDKDGGTTEYTTSVTINNVAPTATFGATTPVDEGTAIALSLTAPSDLSSADTAAGFLYGFDCGSGYGAFTATSTATCPTDDNGPRTVKGSVRDKDGGATEYSATVSVDNVAPTATFIAPASVDEGSPIALSLTDPADPSSADTTATFTHSFDCGDLAGPSAFAAPASTSCATDDNGSRTVGGSIRDKDGGTNGYSASVAIDNVAPTATFGASGTVAEGSPISLELTSPVDPSAVDTAAGFTYAFDCGTGYGSFTSTSTASCATSDSGAVTVKGTIRDKDNGETEYTATVTVTNVDPTATFTVPSSVDEGSSIALSLTDPFDPSSVDSAAGFTYAFDCGSGYGVFTATTTGSCPTDDSGTRTVKGSIRDKDGGTTEYTATVDVDNVAPTATFDASSPVDEGDSIALSLAGEFDPSSVDTTAGFTYAFDCGDGSGFGGYSATSTATCSTDDNGTRTVGGRVRDKDGGVNEYTAPVTIDNVAPEASFDAPSSVNEGSSIALSMTLPTDPSSVDTAAGFEYAFDCGSGYGTFSATSSASCPTDDDGSLTVKGSVRDKDGGTTEFTATVSIDNVAPTALFDAPGSVDEGTDIELVLSAPIDPSAVDTAAGFEFAFDCGSGYGSFGVTSSASCATTDDGSRTVKGSVRDKDGGTTEYTATVDIDNVAPTATFDATTPVNEGADIELSLTAPVDPSSDDTAAGFEYAFDCGSGYGLFGSASSANCPTDDNETRTVKATIRDKDGGSTEYTATVDVDNVAPTAILHAPSSVNEGSDIDVSMSDPIDPSGADTTAGFSYSFDCGDGSGPGPFGTGSAATCATDDNGSRTVAGSIRDKDTGTNTYTAGVDVDNVAPTATFHAPGTVDEGSNIALSLTGPIDPSSVDTAAGFEYAFDCGSGYGAFSGSSTETCSTNDSGSRTVKGSVRDKDGGTTEYTATVTVDNVAPTATFSASSPVNEGSSIALAITSPTDPSGADTAAGFTYAFDCGSGYGAFNATSTASCPTDDNGSRTVKGAIRDKDGGTTEYTATATIDNVAPTAALSAPATVNEASAIALALTGASDPSSVDTSTGFTYAFDCGDGGGYGAFGPTATASCATTDNGTRTLKGTIRDKDGGATEYTATVVINNVAPTINAFTVTQPPGTACASNTVSVAFNVSDPAANSADPITGVVTWGDGATTPISGRAVNVAHTYAPGIYSLTVSIDDGDGGAAAAGGAANVSLLYAMGGIQQPIDAAGTSSFKLGSTIPTKIQVKDCTGAGVLGLSLEVRLSKLLPTTSPVNEVVSSSAADSGNLMRSQDGGQYMFNLSTKRSQFNAGNDLTAGRYRLQIIGASVPTTTVEFNLRA